MCGIAGGIGAPLADVEAMLDRIAHRGPDGRGIYDHRGLVHGHVRLALVDLSSASSQPFRRNGTTLSFNGEIWNYRTLRAALQDQGREFTTTGDTEVLAAALEHYGLDILNSLDGMFAFAWSSPKGEHYLVRDPFGKIPLYVAKGKGGFRWASERKAFPRGWQPIAVPPGCALDLNTGKWIRWYEPRERLPLTEASLIGYLRDAVAKRLEADVPVACLISGGLDSSLIVALARETQNEIVAFTAVYDPKSSDLAAARRFCSELGIPLIEVPVKLDDGLVARAIASVEISSKAQIEIAMLCLPLAERVYAEGFRACLSGEAADELFGGYGNFCIAASRLSNEGVTSLRQEQLAKMARGNFVRCNKSFMSAGVECRLPFMERDLVESAVMMTKEQSPPGKGLLKRAAAGIIPDWIIKRTKDTFQGASGVSRAMAERVSRPAVYYNAELRTRFGYLPRS